MKNSFAISITGSTYPEPERLTVSPAWPDDKDSAGKQFLTDHDRSPSVVRLETVVDVAAFATRRG